MSPASSPAPQDVTPPFGSLRWETFGQDWTVAPEGGSPTPVQVPHDAMIGEPRSPQAPSGFGGAYFPGGRYTYRKTWATPALEPGQRVVVRFEGVSRVSTVSVNGVELGGAPNAYREFEVDVTDVLRAGGNNDIEVVADNSEQPNSRWYLGSGIHRPVSWRVRNPVTLGAHGVHVTTVDTDGPAHVEVLLDLANPDRQTVRADVELSLAGTTVASGDASSDGTSFRFVLEVPDPQLWSADSPTLYDCAVVLRTGDGVADEQHLRVGVRTVTVDATRGLLVNGRPVLLRGGNVHHDNGVIGAVALPAAERRRARILKDHGFNAIRSAHNPLSRAMLEACDEIGLYVMDELTDVWWQPKTRHDDSRTFMTEWRTDLIDSVLRDRNHASVVMYSISNENTETASAAGIEIARQMTALVHELDSTRLVTAGVNLTLNAMASTDAVPPTVTETRGEPGGIFGDMGSTTFNVLSQVLGPAMRVVPRIPRADVHSRGVFDVVDVAGYNYASVRFARDAKAHPSRIVLGTEDMPGHIPEIWELVERLPNVIGDFLWAGWDYLGEVGVGHWEPGRRFAPLLKAYPFLTSGSGVLDITGQPTAAAHLAQATWRTSPVPLIAVRPLDVSEGRTAKSAWRPSDAISSWSWSGREGQTAYVEVYTADAEVELLLDGASLGTTAAGPGHANVARFTVAYRPGILTAVTRGPGGDTRTGTLRSARGPLALRLTADRTELAADGDDLVHVTVEVADADGTVESLADDQVTITVEGPAVLAGFGSGAPATEESFADDVHSTWYGRALAVVRATRTAGTVRVTATSARHGSSQLELTTD